MCIPVPVTWVPNANFSVWTQKRNKANPCTEFNALLPSTLKIQYHNREGKLEWGEEQVYTEKRSKTLRSSASDLRPKFYWKKKELFFCQLWRIFYLVWESSSCFREWRSSHIFPLNSVRIQQLKPWGAECMCHHSVCKPDSVMLIQETHQPHRQQLTLSCRVLHVLHFPQIIGIKTFSFVNMWKDNSKHKLGCQMTTFSFDRGSLGWRISFSSFEPLYILTHFLHGPCSSLVQKTSFLLHTNQLLNKRMIQCDLNLCSCFTLKNKRHH